ncbi:MAG: DUF3040 domain-containing protein [Mycobacteriaceae bacterium]
MSLSEHERRQLQQLEQTLSEEDPEFASQMQGAGMKAAGRGRIAIGVVGALVGLGLVLVGVNATISIGAAGFALMVASVALAVSARQWHVGPRARTRPGHR